MSLWRPDIAPAHEPHKILIRKDVLRDEARSGRAVPFKLYYPVAHALSSLPVIVWSHGLGGSADGAAFLARYIASHGYVVVNVQHHGTDTSLWAGKPGHPWDVIRATPIPRSATIDRFRDVSFLLDALPGWLADHSEIVEHMDMGTLGMSGHSFGALTAQVMAGQGFPDEDGRLLHFGEKRFRAGILYSPVPLHYMSDLPDEELYGTIDRPLLHMTGTADESPVEGFSYEERLRVFDHAGGGDQYLLVLEEGDHMVFTGSRGKLADNPLRKPHEDLIKVFSLAFWDAWLKDDPKARKWLDSAAAGWLDQAGSFRRRPA